MTGSFKNWMFTALLLIQTGFVHADGWFDDETVEARVQVKVAFVEWRSGPAAGYPVIHVSERDEWLSISKRRTSWIKVADDDGREGWVHVDDVLEMHDATGKRVSIREPRLDDFSTRRWEMGLMMGEFDSTAVNAAYAGYAMTKNLSLELWGSQVLGNASEIVMANLNIVHQPFPRWRVSPYFTLGVGHIFVDPKATLVQAEDRDDSTANVGLGLRYYVTARYFLRLEVKDYKVFTNRETNEEATEWKIGLSVFF